MGLLSRLWNLNTVGCCLSEPLRSVVRGGRSRSVDVVGFLRSVLHEAKPYARMKLMIVGVQGIGKTSLLECLRQESAIQHRRKPTDVTQYMQQKNMKMFRDAAELHQATMFLHENGILLHYDDATLKELYFLRPQWLCDILAHVVTVREINPFASNGIMKVDDLAHVFKASPALGGGEEARSLGMSLLNKFELALCWDGRALLVPPLLPDA
ncbi:unnamed protein product, partial [Leptidea sinapis]